MDLNAMRLREGHEGQHIGFGIVHQHSQLGELLSHLRRAKIMRVYDDFATLVPAFRSEDQARAQGEEQKRKAVEQNEITAEKIIVLVRALLNVELLSDMRRELIRRAHNSLIKAQ